MEDKKNTLAKGGLLVGILGTSVFRLEHGHGRQEEYSGQRRVAAGFIGDISVQTGIWTWLSGRQEEYSWRRSRVAGE